MIKRLKNNRKILILLLILCSALCIGFIQNKSSLQAKKNSITVKNANLAYPSKNGRLKVKGSKLVDRKGKPVQLKGISSHGLSWYSQYINKSCFEYLRYRWGVNVMRLSMYTAEYNGYCTGGKSNKKQLKKLIHKGVEAAKKNDMYIIIDWHTLSDNNPNKYKKEAKAFFKEMAKKYKGYNNVIYEICNEPNGSTSWKQIKSYANAIIPVIRKYDKNAIIIVGTPTWSQDVDKAAASPIKGYKNIMYSLHFYAGTHKKDLRNKMIRALSKGLPIFVTEYGICDASGSGSINKKEANKWISTMNKYGVSYVAWNLSNKNETSAILKKSCKKTSRFKTSDLSASGKWLYNMLTSSAKNKGIDLSKKLVYKEETDTSDNQNTGNYTAPKKISATYEKDNVSYHIETSNTWKSGQRCYYQMVLSVENKGENDIDHWSVTLLFSDEIKLEQSWCANISLSQKNMVIKPADYNGKISSGDKIADVGFIISSPGELKFQ